MNVPALKTRVGLSMQAVIAGWAVAFAATLPMQFYEICTNTGGGVGSLLWSLGVGTVIWLLWTLAIAGAGWLVAVLPVVVLVSERWLQRHRVAVVAIAMLLAWSIVIVEFKVWEAFLPRHSLNTWIVSLYTLVFVLLAGVTTIVYLGLVNRLAGRTVGEAGSLRDGRERCPRVNLRG